MKGQILQLNTSIPLKCRTGCLFIKLKFGRVGMGKVLRLRPSWHGPSFKWAKLAWAELSCTGCLLQIGMSAFKEDLLLALSQNSQQSTCLKVVALSNTSI